MRSGAQKFVAAGRRKGLENLRTFPPSSLGVGSPGPCGLARWPRGLPLRSRWVRLYAKTLSLSIQSRAHSLPSGSLAHTCLSLRHLITQVRAYPHTVRASVRLPILAPTDYTTASSASASSASTSDERPPRAAIRENSERVSASASASLHVSPPSAARQAS